jgi:hypothetical protein
MMDQNLLTGTTRQSSPKLSHHVVWTYTSNFELCKKKIILIYAHEQVNRQ